jgi:excisionase family DNA binding protein
MPTPPAPPPIRYTPRHVAELTGVSAAPVRRWVNAGRLAAGRTPGGRLVFSAEQVAALQRQMAGVDAE